MHWSRFDSEVLDGMGFMHAATPAQERLARKMQFDRRANLAYLARHRAALGSDVNVSQFRAGSFAMTQGSFTLLSRAALRVLWSFIIQDGGPARGFLGLAGGRASARYADGKCVLPTDVGLGWLMTHAFSGRSDLHFVNLWGLFELFVWESSRTNKNHTLVVHIASKKVATPDFYDEAFDHGRTPLVSPKLRCAPATWTHAASQKWTECVNVAHCAYISSSTSPPPPPPPPFPSLFSSAVSKQQDGSTRRKQPPPPLKGWLPGSVRDACKAAHSSGGARLGRRLGTARQSSRAKKGQTANGQDVPCAEAIQSGMGTWVSQPSHAQLPYEPACAVLAKKLYGGTVRLCELEAQQQLQSSSREWATAQLERVRLATSWSWQPSPACVHNAERESNGLRVNASRFASRLRGGRRLVLIGDSLSKQHATSLLCLLFPEVDAAATHALREKHGSELAHSFALRGGGVVQFIFNDRLLEVEGGRRVASPAMVDSTRHGRRFESWKRRVRSGTVSRGDVLVLNTGNHWQREHAPLYKHMVTALLASLLDGAARFQGTVIYRTNFLPGCSSERRPTADTVRRREAEHRYVWALLDHFDAAWAAAVHERARASEDVDGSSSSTQLRVLNVSHLTSQRGDGHCEDCTSPPSSGAAASAPDCLHFCLPGPLDAWSALLQEMLIETA